MFEQFPYADMQQLNLDWIIKIAKDFLDQYTHIQEIITNGLTDIDTKTAESIQALEDKKTELEDLLDAWYSTHSEDIAQQLANALDDINAQLTTNINLFNQRAEQKGQDVIDSIPSDYTELAEKVQNLIENNAFNLLPKMTGVHTNNGVTFSWNTDGSCTVSGVQSGGSSSTENLYYNTTLMPTGFVPGETYFVSFSSSNKMRFQVTSFDAGGSATPIFGEYTSGQFTIPSNAIGLFLRLLVVSGATVNETVKPIVRNALSNAELSYNQTDLRPDVLQLQSDVATLQQHEMMMNLSSTTNMNRTDFWEQGSISPVTGMNVVSSERIRTVSYVPTNIADIKLPDTTRGFFICGYDENNTFLGVYNSTEGWTIDNGTGYFEFNTSVIYQKYPTARIRLYLYSRNDIPISLDEAEYIFMSNIYNQLLVPQKIRVMQYNAGQWNFGHDGGYSGPNLGLKLSNYRKLMNDYQPNIVCMQEYREYVDSDNLRNADYIIFNDVLPYKSYEEYGYVAFMDYQPNAFKHTYLHTSGDYPARMVYGSIICNNTQVAVGTAALNALGGSDDASMKIRALAKMIQLLQDFDTAIVGLDANPSSLAEANAIKTYMKSNGFRVANWDYSGYMDTYNPNSSIYKQIDNIFIKGNARFLNVEVVPASRYNDLLSDHLPLIADILIYK